MKAVLFPLALLSCCLLASCQVGKGDFTETSRNGAIAICNDICVGGMYCGSDEEHHYLRIDRKIYITWHEYIKVGKDCLNVAEPKAFSPNEKDWTPLKQAIPDFPM